MGDSRLDPDPSPGGSAGWSEAMSELPGGERRGSDERCGGRAAEVEVAEVEGGGARL